MLLGCVLIIIKTVCHGDVMKLILSMFIFCLSIIAYADDYIYSGNVDVVVPYEATSTSYHYFYSSSSFFNNDFQIDITASVYDTSSRAFLYLYPSLGRFYLTSDSFVLSFVFTDEDGNSIYQNSTIYHDLTITDINDYSLSCVDGVFTLSVNGEVYYSENLSSVPLADISCSPAYSFDGFIYSLSVSDSNGVLYDSFESGLTYYKQVTSIDCVLDIITNSIIYFGTGALAVAVGGLLSYIAIKKGFDFFKIHTVKDSQGYRSSASGGTVAGSLDSSDVNSQSLNIATSSSFPSSSGTNSSSVPISSRTNFLDNDSSGSNPFNSALGASAVGASVLGSVDSNSINKSSIGDDSSNTSICPFCGGSLIPVDSLESDCEPLGYSCVSCSYRDFTSNNKTRKSTKRRRRSV